MKSGVKDLIQIGDKLFKKQPTSLWQALAENFYPQRADFTSTRSPSDEIAIDLMSSMPVLFCRELSDIIPSIMRPRHLVWAELHASNEDVDQDEEARMWMEWATKVVRKAIYDPVTGFTRATKETDRDWVAFGNAVLLPQINQTRDALLYQNFHIRDCAWSVNAAGQVDQMFRKWMPTARNLCKMFPATVSSQVEKIKDKEPFKEIKCRHIAIPRDNYVYDSSVRGDSPYISLYVDVENEVVLEELGQSTFRYVVPRWQTISGSPYARSPVTEIMLPDARTQQVLTRIILEAGEKAVDPAMVAAEETFRSDFDLRAGGVTWADIEADQRLQDKFMYMAPDKSGLPAGFEISAALREALSSGFYINKLNLPPAGSREMTAYETRKRIEEHLRQIAPLFEPVEEDYNAPMMDETFQILMEWGAFGPTSTIPEILLEQDVRFTFQSPLRETDEELNAHRFMEGLQVIQAGAQLDEAMLALPKTEEASRDALKGVRWPQKWLATVEEVAEARERIERQKQAQMGMQGMDAMAGAAEKAGRAVQAFEQSNQ